MCSAASKEYRHEGRIRGGIKEACLGASQLLPFGGTAITPPLFFVTSPTSFTKVFSGLDIAPISILV